MVFGKEPAVIVAILAALVQIVLVYTTGDINAAVPAWVDEALTVLVTLLAGIFVRSQVASRNTVNQAGYTMEELETRAASPAIEPAKEP